jgi:hypothetical protein
VHKAFRNITFIKVIALGNMASTVYRRSAQIETLTSPGHAWGICLFSILRREFDLFSGGRWGIC